MKSILQIIGIFIFLTAMLLLLFSCIEKKESILNSKEGSDTKQKNIEFLCSLSENIQNGDTVFISFGLYGSLSKNFFKARLNKMSDTIFIELFGQENEKKQVMNFGRVMYGLKLYRDSLSFEHLFINIFNDSSISYEKKPGYKRIITILSNRFDRIDIYIEKECMINEYINNYFYHLILFYFPHNQFIPRIVSDTAKL